MAAPTNTALHLPAIAYDFGINISLKTFDEFSREIPHLTSIRPSGQYVMGDFDRAGGVPAIMKRIKDLLSDQDTVSGKSVHEIADEARITDEECIRPMDRPYHRQGGIAILFGNLAPEGSVVKQAAVSEKMMRFEGRCPLFRFRRGCQPGHLREEGRAR